MKVSELIKNLSVLNQDAEIIAQYWIKEDIQDIASKVLEVELDEEQVEDVMSYLENSSTMITNTTIHNAIEVIAL